MSKRGIAESIDKLKTLVEGNDSISVNLQTKLMKQINTISKHSKPSEPKKKREGLSQFEKPKPVSAEFIAFAGWEPNAERSRVEVMNKIWSYVKENKLQQPNNGRVCLLDATLKTLLDTQVEKLTFPEFQKYIGRHFIAVDEQK